MKVYLDNAATTPIDSNVLKAMMPYFKERFGNPASVHSWGQEAYQAIDKAREQVAKFLNCKFSEVIFTGSATESNNLAIKGLAKSHVVTTAIEHKSVLKTCKNFKTTYLKYNFSLKDLEKAITPKTDLVSIMYANNETGEILPIKEIGKIVKKHNVYFHVDAVQAINWFKIDLTNIDLLTFSGHKIYGPKGVGVLYVRQGVPLKPIITGGAHELGLRAGTENVAGIVGLGEAVNSLSKCNAKVKKLKDKLVKGALKIKGVKLNGSGLPNIANLSFDGVEGEGLAIALDQEGVGVSTGSACTSEALVPSHVLMAMGLSHEQTHSSLRFSLGKHTTAKEIDYVLKVLPKVLNRLRKISGYV